MASPFGLYELMQLGVPYADAAEATGTNVPRVMRPPLPNYNYRMNQPSGMQMPTGGKAGPPALQNNPVMSRGFTLGPSTSTISDAAYRPVGPQKQLGYNPMKQLGYNPVRETITSKEALDNIKRFGKPYTQEAAEGTIQRVLPKAAPVLKAGISGAGGAVLTDMLFPAKANEFDDVAAINAYDRNKTQGLFASSHGQPSALGDYKSDLAKFKERQMMQESDYGKVPGSAIIRDAKTGKVLAKGLGEATGGFAMKEENRLAEVARQDADQKAFWDQVNASKARETADIQNSNAVRLQSAIASGDYRQADALTKALQASSGIHPLDMSNQAGVDIKRSMMPAQNKLAESQANLFGQQAAAIPYNTAIQKYIAEHAAKNQPQDFNSKVAALVKSGLDPEQAIALAGIPDNATAEQRQQVLNLINERKKG